MTLSVRAKNLIMGGSLAAFAGSVFAYTVIQLSKVLWQLCFCWRWLTSCFAWLLGPCAHM